MGAVGVALPRPPDSALHADLTDPGSSVIPTTASSANAGPRLQPTLTL
jgi:hypothetical protein